MYVNDLTIHFNVLLRFKVHHAVQQAIEQNLDSIILIFLQNIPDYKLNHALCLRRGMFKSHCILNWPVQKERINAFHHKLQVALGSIISMQCFVAVEMD